MYTISKEFNFSAGHYLKGLSKEHPCSKQHGHNYIVIVELKAKVLNKAGFVKDYRELESIEDWIDITVDHKNLNDVFPEMNPTAENLAKLFFEEFFTFSNFISAVTVKETNKTAARYEPDNN